jgi:poly-gamma-glutamate capsule biosynthesis protein CapA/YwtB (metallophosphatase superfamily)
MIRKCESDSYFSEEMNILEQILGGDDGMISIVATGDSLATMRLSVFDEEAYRSMLEILRSGDISFTNLEMLLGNFESAPAAESGGTYVMGEPFMAEELKWMGFNLYSRANNHSLDFGEGGLLSTTRILDRLGLAHAGVGENLTRARSPVYLETKNGRVAMISMSSSFASFGRAGDARGDLIGRPGLSPLRYQAKLVIPRGLMHQLTQVFKEAGVPIRKEKEGVISVMNQRFAGGTKSEIITTPNEADLKGIIASVKDAKRQADYVLVSLHAHEARGSDRERPAEFMEIFCRKCLDAGASAIIGHGPHLLRGIEIYKKKPIMYSLGNFIFMNETVRFQPADNYEKVGLGSNATPADFYDERARRGKKPEGGHKWFTYDPVFWEGAISKMAFENGNLRELQLYPVTLGFEKTRSQRGRPMLAEGKHAKAILERIRRLSSPYGTKIDIVDGVGQVVLQYSRDNS